VATSKRSPNFPNLPTIAESGLPGYDSTAWQGLAGPAGLPPDVVKRLNEAFNTVMAMPAVREKLTGGGLEVVGGPPEQFARFIAAEITKWTKIANGRRR
jgi:tripartite-type tricarboxylate transporter receptor subunit TctC